MLFTVHTRQWMPPFYGFMYEAESGEGFSPRALAGGPSPSLEILPLPPASDPAGASEAPVPLARRIDRIRAGSARGAALEILDRILEPRRRRIRELDGPGAVLESMSRAVLEAALEPAEPDTWRCAVGVDEVLEFTCAWEG